MVHQEDAAPRVVIAVIERHAARAHLRLAQSVRHLHGAAEHATVNAGTVTRALTGAGRRVRQGESVDGRLLRSGVVGRVLDVRAREVLIVRRGSLREVGGEMKVPRSQRQVQNPQQSQSRHVRGV